MGAAPFMVYKRGIDANDAFERAVAQAHYEYGHIGYTGTIAEKHDIVLIVPPVGVDARGYAEQLIDSGDERIDNKWGPAGCIDCGPTKDGKDRVYLFFGWASE